jgi:hypothetical protein
MRSKLGYLFLAAAMVLSLVAFAGRATAQDPWCTGTTEETCPDSDEHGCNKMNQHYWCTWSTAIEHCNCTLIWPGGD